jgi:large subunit ribosomal protein L16
MLVPNKTKYRKHQKGRVRSNTKSGFLLSFGSHGLKALTSGRINSRQIESARIAATKCMQRRGKLWIKVFPSIPVSKKPAEVRMGKGKGNPEYFVFRVSPGRLLFELAGVSDEICVRALMLASGKIPFKTKVISRNEVVDE